MGFFLFSDWAVHAGRVPARDGMAVPSRVFLFLRACRVVVSFLVPVPDGSPVREGLSVRCRPVSDGGRVDGRRGRYCRIGWPEWMDSPGTLGARPAPRARAETGWDCFWRAWMRF